MKYYLVAVLSKEDNRELEQLQRPLIKKAKNKKAPYMAVLMDTIEDPDLKKLEELLRGLLAPFRYFHIDAVGNYINSPAEKVTGLKVSNFGYIKKVQRHLNDYMSLSNFKVHTRNEDEDFILSMSSEKLPKNFETEHKLFDSEKNEKKFMVQKIELWKTLNAKKDAIVFSIALKNPKIL